MADMARIDWKAMRGSVRFHTARIPYNDAERKPHRSLYRCYRGVVLRIGRREFIVQLG